MCAQLELELSLTSDWLISVDALCFDQQDDDRQTGRVPRTIRIIAKFALFPAASKCFENNSKAIASQTCKQVFLTVLVRRIMHYDQPRFLLSFFSSLCFHHNTKAAKRALSSKSQDIIVTKSILKFQRSQLFDAIT